MSRMTKIIYKSKPGDFLNKTNHSGFPACERSDREKYIQTLLCNNFGRTYYADENDMTRIAADMHQKMIREDPEFAAKAIVYARNKGFMRSQSIYGLAVLADKDPVLFEKIFDKVVQIPGDLKDFIGVLSGPANNFGLSKGEGGRVVKRCAAGYLNEMSEYHALKYGAGGSGAYDLADIIRTIHPKPKNDLQSKLFRYIVNGDDEKIKIDESELETLNKARASIGLDTIDWVAVGMDLSALPQVEAFEKLKSASSPAEVAELVREYKLPHEKVTGAVPKMTGEIWDALVKDMPLKATLRAFNTLNRASMQNGENVLDHNRALIAKRLSDGDAIKNAKILPTELMKAYKVTSKAWVRDALRVGIESGIANIPEIPGKTAILIDASGSMDAPLINKLDAWQKRNAGKQVAMVENLEDWYRQNNNKPRRMLLYSPSTIRGFSSQACSECLYTRGPTPRCICSVPAPARLISAGSTPCSRRPMQSEPTRAARTRRRPSWT